MSQVKLNSEVSKCGSGPVTQPSSDPLEAVIPGKSEVRKHIRVWKCKPGSQVSRSGSGSAGYISRHRHGSTVAQSAAKDKSLSSNFSAKERGGNCFSQQSGLRLFMQLCHTSTPGQVIKFKEAKVYLGPEEIAHNHNHICCILLFYL